MTSTIASSANGPMTLRLNPFHNGSQLRQHSARQPNANAPPHAGGARIAPNAHHAQSNNPRQIPNLPSLRIPRNMPIARSSQNPHPAPSLPGASSSKDKHTPAPKLNNRASMYESTRPVSTAVVKRNGSTSLRGYAIAPVSNTSIDSIIRADTLSGSKKSEVPNLIRPKSEAINTASEIISIRIPAAIQSSSSSTDATSSKVLRVHADVLTKSSEWLQARINGPSKLNEPAEICIEDTDAVTANIYTNWLYHGRIHSAYGKDEQPPSTATPEAYTGLSRLIKCHLLGQKLQDPHFQDATLDAIVSLVCMGKEQGKTMLSLMMQRVKHHYIQLPVGSKARRLVVHLYAHFGDWRLLSKEDPRAFLWETGEVLKRGAADDPVAAAAKCVFHVHQAGVCYRDC